MHMKIHKIRMRMNKILDQQDNIGIREYIITMKIEMNRRETRKGRKRKIVNLKENKREPMLIAREDIRGIIMKLEEVLTAMV